MSSEMADLVLAEAGEKMERAVARARSDFTTVRTGRASSGLVEKLLVDYYGSEVPLRQIASFSVPEARQLLITPYDKGAMGAVERAIQQSDLGLNPSNDGVHVRLNFPPLTGERRKDLVRLVKQMSEDGKVALRNLRRSARHDLEALEKDGELSSDELSRAEKELDKLIHAREADIDRALAAKEEELLED